MPRRDGEVFRLGTAITGVLELFAPDARIESEEMSRAYRGWLSAIPALAGLF
jgi:hypothetical protein